MKNSIIPSTRKTIGFISGAIAVTFIILVVLNFNNIINGKSKNKSNSLLKTKPVIVITGSMDPVIKVNSLSLLKYCNIDDIKIGDIVMYDYNRLRITHRVIDIATNDNGDKYLTTKGDANEFYDSLEVTSEMVVGKIVKTYNNLAPYISYFMITPGEINSAAVSQAILFIVVFVAVASFIIYQIGQFISTIMVAITNNKKFDDYIERYDTLSQKHKKLEHELKELQNSKSNRMITILAKAKAIREIKALEEGMKDFEKGMKVIRYFRRWFGKNM